MKITLVKDKDRSDQWVGYGSDTWGMAFYKLKTKEDNHFKLRTPEVNYVFRASLNETDQVLSLKWDLISLFDGQENKPKRNNQLGLQWIEEIQKTLSGKKIHPYMTYELKIQL
jgi:hypothetical protein